MAKYHINNAGIPSICRATTRPCPLGGEHFDSKQEAVKFAQETNKKTYSLFPGMVSEKTPLAKGAGIDKNTLAYEDRWEAVGQQLWYAIGSSRSNGKMEDVERMIEGGHILGPEDYAEYEAQVFKALDLVTSGTNKWGDPQGFREYIEKHVNKPMLYRSAKMELARNAGENPEKYKNYLSQWSVEDEKNERFHPDINDGETIVLSVRSDGTRSKGIIDEHGEFVIPPVFDKITNGRYLLMKVNDQTLRNVAENLDKGYYIATVENSQKDIDSTYFVISKETGKTSKIEYSYEEKSWTINNEKLNEKTFSRDLENTEHSVLDFEYLMPKYLEDYPDE